MKSTKTPHTHSGVTIKELTIEFGPGRLKQEVVVPQGTRCVKLDGGQTTWVVDDLGFLPDRNSILYHDADHYGIRLQESDVTNIVAR